MTLIEGHCDLAASTIVYDFDRRNTAFLTLTTRHDDDDDDDEGMNGLFPSAASSSGGKPVDLLHAGSTPGALDPSQRDRILREPGSRLYFAAFDPLTAGGQGASLDFRKMSLSEEQYRPKRVVIEVFPNGQSTWRFVPRAKLDDGVIEEGFWPRVIDICGQLVNCTQEQWDIYKLDPLYDCAVNAYPKITTITLRQTPLPRPPSPLRKRPHSSSSPGEPLPATKKVHYEASVTMRSVSSLTSEESDTDTDVEAEEVEEMVTDELFRPNTPTLAHGKRFKPSSPAKPTIRRTKPISQAAAAPPPPPPNPISYHQSRQSQSMPPENQKRKAFEPTDITNNPVMEEAHLADDEGPVRKRGHFEPYSMPDRTTSPGVALRQRQAKRREKQFLKRERWEQVLQAKRTAREQRLMDEIMADVPPPVPPQGSSSMGSSSSGSPSSLDPDEAARLAAIEESRRKLAELEADRPLWDAAARERRAKEEAEEEERRRKAEAKRRAEEQRIKQARERQAQKEREEEDRRRREELEREAARAKVARDREARKARWSSGRWTHSRAVERFSETCDYFDMTRFSETHPLTIEDVPWPTLVHPRSFSLEDIEWSSVEQFFDVLRTHLRTQEYVAVVEKCHRRFHPDRWRSRNLFKAVLDPSERNCMEVAATTVSQAITPIWQKVRAIRQA
ncbi:hypothetical protein CC1G_09344 [Coprinopsis cinerea okayama7|uniref:Uncharacterized protein n=1 Tax=Coprinopsis cinerea (strain Okayama-7 / 130 / ATCC MYA-4618 / FGSC 9003) TaxID=240176 RepID=A8N5N9_COPC7|nr:hypothetical protein CC1G_09344 [Coprinopsis cinerea okayama7\|eukprot:XP_001830184.2 hypothetical protein CC1G_09344 [Coprinopsis cinerea okayama7\